MHIARHAVVFASAVLLAVVQFQRSTAEEPLRVGIIGCDTSHVIAFTRLLNDPKASGLFADVRVVAAYPGGSDDLPDSYNRIDRFTEQLGEMGLEIVDSIPELLELVDVVLLESVDGRKHLEQAKPVIAAGKPLFIDKPLAGSLQDAVEILELAADRNVPCFSSSGLRFCANVVAMKKNAKLGDIVGCTAYGPCKREPHHPDLFYYGVHTAEILCTIMGEGCTTVSRTESGGTDIVVGTWKDGRIGTLRGIRAGKAEYGAIVFGTAGIDSFRGFSGYRPLVEAIVLFFKTGKPPVTAEQTLEVFAFMEAADESKRQNGAPVTLQSVLEKARKRK